MTEKRKVTVDGEEFEVEIRPDEGNWEVTIEGTSYTVEIAGSQRKAPRKRRAPKSSGAMGSGIISSAIPGKIVAIMASEGDDVKEDSVVIVLEAMKMQNEIKAPIDGRIKKVTCKPGERIEANVPLLEIEKDDKGE